MEETRLKRSTRMAWALCACISIAFGLAFPCTAFAGEDPLGVEDANGIAPSSSLSDEADAGTGAKSAVSDADDGRLLGGDGAQGVEGERGGVGVEAMPLSDVDRIGSDSAPDAGNAIGGQPSDGALQDGRTDRVENVCSGQRSATVADVAGDSLDVEIAGADVDAEVDGSEISETCASTNCPPESLGAGGDAVQ